MAQYQPKESFFSASLGPGTLISTNIRKDNQNKRRRNNPILMPIPYLSLKIGPVRLAGIGLRAHLYRYKFLSVFLSIRRLGDRYHGPEMDFRKPSFFIGGGVNLFFLNYRFLKDMQSKSSGVVQQILFRHRYLLSNNFFLNMSLGFEYADKNYNQYYFGVRSHEVRSYRALYKAEGDWSPVSRVMAMIKINERWSSIISLNYKHLSSQVKNSPTVIKSGKITSFLGLGYRLTK